MKFTKLTSSVLAGATLLSIMAPTATFAKTAINDDVVNGGTRLPQEDHTEVGISFGDNTNNGNTGYLRLQMVPHVLDFGNHNLFNKSNDTFTSDGLNGTTGDNDLHVGYDNTDTNKTVVLNTEDAKLSNVKNKVWATVVDKQATRDMKATDSKGNPLYDGTTTDDKAGTWKLSVKSTDTLKAVDSADNPITEPANDKANEIVGAHLNFANTAYDRTQEVFALTTDTQDKDWNKDLTDKVGKDVDAAGIVSDFGTELMANGADQTVATAQAGEGLGANVFGWNKSDVKLTLPQTAVVKNAIYKAHLTWTLTSDITTQP